MPRRVGIVRVTKDALAAVFAPGGVVLDARVTDADFHADTVSLKVEADWCPVHNEGEELRVVESPSLASMRREQQGEGGEGGGYDKQQAANEQARTLVAGVLQDRDRRCTQGRHCTVGREYNS